MGRDAVSTLSVFGKDPPMLNLTFPGLSSSPELPPPPPPPPTREDPEVVASKERQRLSELRRKGRRSTVLTGGQGVEESELGAVSRPEARSGAQLLGQ